MHAWRMIDTAIASGGGKGKRKERERKGKRKGEWYLTTLIEW